MDSEGWFHETEAYWPGQRFSLKMQAMLHEEQTEFQLAQVFDSHAYGRVLVLDGVIQLTEKDECSYQEMIAHVPLFAHPDPKRVLIIGGGDGGVARETAKHAGVEHIVQVEIDSAVPRLSKTYFVDTVATGFMDSRVDLRFMDGKEFLKTSTEVFDVIIVDSSDPIGPNISLFEKDFYSLVKTRLNPKNGIICTQGENQWLHLDFIHELMGRCKKVFGDNVTYYKTNTPTYPSGQIGFIVSCMDPSINMQVPSRERPEKEVFHYYTQEMHYNSFVLPQFSLDKLGKYEGFNRESQAKVKRKVALSVGIAGLVLGLVVLVVRK